MDRYFAPFLKWLTISLLIGAVSGSAAAFFLWTLEGAQWLRLHYPLFIWFLPLAGFFIGWLFFKFGKSITQGTNLILEEIHNPTSILPARMAPMIWLGTILTHLFGGSAGREGTAVQMSASLSDQLGRFFKLTADERKSLLVAGTGAGFGAAVGAPLAGFVFGLEVVVVGKLKPAAWLQGMIAAFVGYGVSLLWHAPHSQFSGLLVPALSLDILFFVILAGVVFGVCARTFVYLTHWFEKCMQWKFKFPPLRPFIGGLGLVTLYFIEGSYRYVGLGIPIIENALTQVGPFLDPFFKLLFTVVTVGSGFKGGEFIPLVFIGTTLGSALGGLVPVTSPLLAGLGFAAVFAGAANTPFACTFLAMEIFGWEIGPYALIACYVSFLCSGKKGIYKKPKSQSLLRTFCYELFRKLKSRHRSEQGL